MKPEKFKELAKGCPWRTPPELCRAYMKSCQEKNCAPMFWLGYFYGGRTFNNIRGPKNGDREDEDKSKTGTVA